MLLCKWNRIKFFSNLYNNSMNSRPLTIICRHTTITRKHVFNVDKIVLACKFSANSQLQNCKDSCLDGVVYRINVVVKWWCYGISTLRVGRIVSNEYRVNSWVSLHIHPGAWTLIMTHVTTFQHRCDLSSLLIEYQLR